MKGNPAVPGGPLTSKPAWSNTQWYSTTPVFFHSRWRATAPATREGPNDPIQFGHGATGRLGGQRLRTAANGPRTHVGDRGPERGHAGGHATRGPVAGREGL